MTRTLEQIDAALTAVEATVKGLATPAVATPTASALDPRWYTPMTAEEIAAFDTANPFVGGYIPDASGQGGEIALQRARRGWTDKQSGVTPAMTGSAILENSEVATMGEARFATLYGPITRELACYLNLTNRKGVKMQNADGTQATSVDQWVTANKGGPGVASG